MFRTSKRWRLWAESVASALLPAFPAVGSLVFLGGSRRGTLRDRLVRALATGVPLFVLSGFRAVFDRGHSSVHLAGEGVIAVAAFVAIGGERRTVSRGLVLAVLGLCTLLGYGWWFSAHAWSSYNPLSSWSHLRWFGSELLTGVNSRTWLLRGDENQRLSLQIRLVKGDPTWAWSANDARFRQTRLEGAKGAYTKVIEPSGGNPYLSRIYYASAPLSGRTFRFSTDLKLASPYSPGEETGISATGSAGVHPVKLSSTWQTVSFRWTIPSSTHSRVLRIVLERFYGLTFDVRNAHLDELTDGSWRARAPLVGNGVDIYLAQARTLAEHVYLPTRSWQRVALTHTGPAPIHGRVTAVIRVGPGLTVAIRRARLADPTGAGPPPMPVLRFVRQTLWYPHPNLLGHTLAVTALAWLALTQAGWLALLGWVVACVGTALTGSRAALVVLVLGGFLLLLLMQTTRPARWRLALGLAGLLLLAAMGLGARRAAFRVGLGLDTTDRPKIWSVALTALAQHPLDGVGSQGFQQYYETLTHEISATAPEHAHDQWLSFAADYGLPGLITIVWFTTTLARLAWRGGRRATVFLAAVYLLQLIDTTLFFSSVFLVTLLVLATSKGRAPARLPSPEVAEGGLERIVTDAFGRR